MQFSNFGFKISKKFFWKNKLKKSRFWKFKKMMTTFFSAWKNLIQILSICYNLNLWSGLIQLEKFSNVSCLSLFLVLMQLLFEALFMDPSLLLFQSCDASLVPIRFHHVMIAWSGHVIEFDQKNGKYLICGTPQLRKSNNFVAQLKSKRLRVK